MPAAATETGTASRAMEEHSRAVVTTTAVELTQSKLPAEPEVQLQEAFDDE